MSMDEAWEKRITIEAGKRGGRPCIRGMRISVDDVLSYLSAGSSLKRYLTIFLT